MKWFKNLFKKKLEIPWWFFGFGSNNPTTMSKQEYKEFTDKCVNALMEGKSVILKINGEPYIMTKEEGFFGKINLRKLEKDEYKVVL